MTFLETRGERRRFLPASHAPRSRRIEVEEPGPRRLLATIARSRATVVLSGITRRGTPSKTCEVAVLWADSP